MRKKFGKKTFHDIMMDTQMTVDTLEEYLDECINQPLTNPERIPLRYRIFAYGFLLIKDRERSEQMDILEAVDRKLIEAGCEKLYARNIQEAVLMYAYHRKLPYETWKELNDYASSLYQEREKAALSYTWLTDYVEQNSTREGNLLLTRHLTRKIKEDFLTKDERDFILYLEEHMDSFSAVREKARYYFCKYLNYFIAERIEAYIWDQEAEKKRGRQKPGKTESSEMGIGMRDDLGSHYVRLQNVLLGISALSRNKTWDGSEIRKEIIRNASVRCAGIDALFTYYYFGADRPADWINLLEENVTEEEYQELGSVLLEKHPRKFKGMSKASIGKKEMDYVYEIARKREDAEDAKAGTFKTGRSGERRVRALLDGSFDINRTTLVCYLLFFADKTKLPPAHQINKGRMNTILAECGFSELDEKNDFDSFVLGYLKSLNPKSYIQKTLIQCAYEERNFYAHPLGQYNKKEDISNDAENRREL